MNELTTKENIKIELINKSIERYFDNLNFCKEFAKLPKIDYLYVTISKFRNKGLSEICSLLEDIKEQDFESKLKIAFLEKLFFELELEKFMNFEQKENLSKDIEKLVDSGFQVSKQSVLNLISGYANNIDKAIYDSVTALAGYFTDRTSEHKTNSTAIMFQNKHIVKDFMGDYSINYYRKTQFDDLLKIHNLFFNDKINILNYSQNLYRGDIKLSNNLNIKIYQNGNMHIFMSQIFQDKLNNMINKNILK